MRASRGSRATWTVARAGYGSAKYAAVHGVHRRKVVHVSKKDGRADDRREVEAAGVEQGADVLHDLTRFGRDIARHEGAGRGSSGTCPETNRNWPARMAGE